MCGIVGEIHLKNRPIAKWPDAHARLHRALDTLKTRGPDGEGTYANHSVLMGHRLLSIFETPQQAQQPMTDRTLGLAITFNGAIYNHDALRTELEQFGYHFKTKTDTEILLKAYDKWGRDHPDVFLHKLDGMFAFAIHDQRGKSVFIARDPLGQKPLYYNKQPDRLLFGSTPQSLYAFGGIDDTLDPVALAHHQANGVFAYSPHTLLKGVKKFPAAHYMVIEEGKAPTPPKQYWEAIPTSGVSRSEKEHIDAVEEALFESVETCFAGHSEKPVGLFLSGGIDSALILAAMHKAGREDIPTFSYGYETYDPSIKSDEFDASDPLVARYKTNHTKIVLGHNEQLERLDGAIERSGEPIGAFDNVSRQKLTEAARDSGVKVVLGGEGADEVFAGYKQLMDAAKKPGGKALIDHYVQSFFTSHIAESNHPAHQKVACLFEQAARHHLSPLQSAVYVHLMSVQPDSNFLRIENWTADKGVEFRAPYVGKHLLTRALSLPDELKAKEGVSKPALRAVGRRYLDASITESPKFFPQNPAFSKLPTHYSQKISEALLSREAKESGLFTDEQTAALLANRHSHSYYQINNALSAYVMLHWLGHNKALIRELQRDDASPKRWADTVSHSATKTGHRQK